MKFGILKNRDDHGRRGGSETFTHLLLKNTDDLLQ